MMKKTIKIVTSLLAAVLVILLAFVLLKGCGSSKVDKSGFYSKDTKTSKMSSSSSKSLTKSSSKKSSSSSSSTQVPRLKVVKLVSLPVPLLVQQLQHQNKRKLKHHLNLFQVKVTVLIKLEPQLLNLIRKQVMAVGKPLLVL